MLIVLGSYSVIFNHEILVKLNLPIFLVVVWTCNKSSFSFFRRQKRRLVASPVVVQTKRKLQKYLNLSASVEVESFKSVNYS